MSSNTSESAIRTEDEPLYVQPIEVRFQEVDAAGIVFFPRIIAYFHDAYVGLLADRGFPLNEVLERGEWLAPIRHAEADFRRPVKFGEPFVVRLTEATFGESAMTLCWSLCSAGSGEVHATGKTVHVFVDRSFHRMQVPENLRRAILRTGN